MLRHRCIAVALGVTLPRVQSPGHMPDQSARNPDHAPSSRSDHRPRRPARRVLRSLCRAARWRAPSPVTSPAAALRARRARQLRRPRGQAAAGGGQRLVHPDRDREERPRARVPGRKCRCSRPARRSSNSSRISSTATSQGGNGGRRPAGAGAADAEPRVGLHHRSVRPDRDQQPRHRGRRRDHRDAAGQHHAEGHGGRPRRDRRHRAAEGEAGQAAADGGVRRFRRRRASATGCWRSAIRSAWAAP